MKTRILEKSQIKILSDALIKDKIVAFPTETVYGLGIIYDSEKAMYALKEAKERPENKPFTLMIADKKMISQFAVVRKRDQILIDAFMPGPITFIFKKQESVDSAITNGFDTIGIRYPNDSFIIDLISQVGKPLLVPSANISGYPPALNHLEVLEQLGGRISYVVKGECASQVASTIIDLTGDDLKLIRQGEISIDDMRRKLDESSNGE